MRELGKLGVDMLGCRDGKKAFATIEVNARYVQIVNYAELVGRSQVEFLQYTSCHAPFRKHRPSQTSPHAVVAYGLKIRCGI